MRDYYYDVEIDLGSSGVDDLTIKELREITNLPLEAIDELVLRDGHSLGGDAIRHRMAERWAVPDLDRIMVTHGSSEANYLVMQAILRRGDEVIVLDPCYQQLFGIAAAVGCDLIRWPIRFDSRAAPDVGELRDLISPRTRMVVVNFPHNPTGATLSHDDFGALLDIVRESGAYLVCDSAFAALTYDEAPLPRAFSLYDRAIELGTLSKAYGLPGLRMGWCIAPPSVLEEMIRIRDFITLHVSPLIEFLALHVFTHEDAILERHRALARTNLAVVEEWATQHADSVEWYRPGGGVSAFPRLTHHPDTRDFCRELAERERTLLVPGSCFNRPAHVRLGFGRRTRDLVEGLNRLSRHLSSVAAR